jgi:hypothetical protein
MHRPAGQEGLDLGFGGEEIFARPRTLATDESYDPLDRGSLSVHGAVMVTEHLWDFIE